MCGITGFWQSGGMRSDDAYASLGAMSACIAHRGPDDDGAYVDARCGVALGFRRLAILDLTPLGHQPMQSPSGRFWITFNGEIYNHRQLRGLLEREGVRFRGRSDTEVLCAGLEVWGIRQTFERAAGMFAVAIWDTALSALTLVRDRVGIKPLYFYSEPGFLSYGSELKSLHRGPRFDPTIDAVALSEYSSLLYVPGPRSIFTHVSKLPPGTLLTISDPSRPLPAPEAYWSLEHVAKSGRLGDRFLSENEGAQLLEQTLTQVIAEHMESDVPLGAFLSGGIDSSLVVSLMSRVATGTVKTFTVQFDDVAHDESVHAEAVAKHLGTDHTTIPLRGDEALDYLPSLCEHYDEPFADASQIPSLLVCKAARQHATVVLTGDGGDELFAGYNRYLYGIKAFPQLDRIPPRARRVLAWSLRAASGPFLEQGYSTASRFIGNLPKERLVADKARKLARILEADTDVARYNELVSTERRVSSARTLPSALHESFEGHPNSALLDRMLLADQLSYLPDNQMTKVDRASMAASLEARVPLLDHRVLEVAWRLGPSALIHKGQSKWPLRKLLYDLVPPALLDRPKTGFSVPLSKWLRGPLRPWAEERFSRSALAQSPVDGAEVRATWTAFLAGRDSLASSVWTSLVFENWRSRWL